ncbi:MAG: hypothetical protein QW272_08280 [Candidatus Methanomethylicaceae archaeon]
MENSLKKLRNKGIRIVYTDNASYYHLACKWIRIEHRVYNINLKNIIERFIQIIKDRIECFDDYFPCFNECNYEHVKEWINSFKIDYNLIRIHGFIKKATIRMEF